MRLSYLGGIFCMTLVACATPYSAPESGSTSRITVENETRAAAVMLFEDEHCTKHRSGEWLGSVGKGKPLMSLPTKKSFDVPANERVVIQMIWYNGWGRECGGALMINPSPEKEYKFVYAYFGTGCAISGYARELQAQEYTLLDESEATPVKVCAP